MSADVPAKPLLDIVEIDRYENGFPPVGTDPVCCPLRATPAQAQDRVGEHDRFAPALLAVDQDTRVRVITQHGGRERRRTRPQRGR